MKITHCFKAGTFILAAALFAGPGFITHAAAQERAYFIDLNTRTATDLGSLGGGQARPEALNDSGQVVGSSSISAGGYHAFITGANGKGMRDLGTLGGTNSWALGINNAGQVVGSSDTSPGASHAFMTGVGGMSMQDLTASRRIGSATDINDKGQVVGWFSDGTGIPGDFQAFITGPNGAGMARIAGDPDEIPAWLFIVPSSINAAGQVAGSAGDPPSRPFITGENAVGIRDVGTSGSGVDGSYASGINDAGQVVGSYVTRELTLSRPYITGPDGVGMRYLGTPGESDGYASSVNDSGQVVGTWYNAVDGTPHPFVTGPNGVGITDLNSLVDMPGGVILTWAADINNAGQVIAIGVIPEPETYAMFLAGLGLLGFVAGRKRSRSKSESWLFPDRRCWSCRQ